MASVNGVSAEEQTIREAHTATEGAVRESAAPPSDHVTLSNGIALKLRPVSGLLIRRAASQVPKPVVPTHYSEDRGRDEPWPGDPDYIAELERYDETTSMAAMNVMFLLGTKVESVPEHISGHESDEWLGDLRFLGIDVHDTMPGRYLDWLKYIALEKMEDLLDLSAAVGRMSGLQEQDVMAAIDSFRRGEARGADSVVDAEDAGDGDPVLAAGAGDGARD